MLTVEGWGYEATAEASRKPVGVAIIGCGAIGGYLAKALDRGVLRGFKLRLLYDKVLEKAYKLSSSLVLKPKVASSFREIIEAEDVDLVIEAASQEAVKSYSLQILESGKSLMIMSVGALTDVKLYNRLKEVAESRGIDLLIPSGAIAGLDAVKAASIAGVSSVTLTSRKPPKVFQDNPYVKARGIDLSRLKEPLLLYEGAASEACRLFPSSINVAATLSLASLASERMIVRVIADPSVSGNVHEVVVEGEFGRLRCVTVNKPTPENPKTSFLAALSALATLRKIVEKIHVGT